MKFLDKLNNVLDKLYTNQESMIYFYIALGALAAILILLIIITSIRIKKTQKKINKSDEVVVETGTPKTEETPEVKLETAEVKKEEPVVFILWGNFAKSKKVFITNPKHLVLTSPHPSPFSARYGFFGSHPFSKTNEFLEKNGEEKINWDLN